jgi:hypothetical protein
MTAVLPRRDPGRTLQELNAAITRHFTAPAEPVTGEITRVDPLTAPIVDLGIWDTTWDAHSGLLLAAMALGWQHAHHLLVTLTRIGPDPHAPAPPTQPPPVTGVLTLADLPGQEASGE